MFLYATYTFAFIFSTFLIDAFPIPPSSLMVQVDGEVFMQPSDSSTLDDEIFAYLNRPFKFRNIQNPDKSQHKLVLFFFFEFFQSILFS